mgnify:CR=1 FL=1
MSEFKSCMPVSMIFGSMETICETIVFMSLINVFKDLAESALDAVKDFFGIASPSKVMRDQVGKMLPLAAWKRSAKQSYL